jgi:hypothetical protein
VDMRTVKGRRGAHKNARSKAGNIRRRAERRARAEALLVPYRRLTTEQKLSRLPRDGAKRQRARLESQLSAERAAA